MTFFTGKPDCCKSMVLLDLIARATAGRDFPDDSKNENPPCKVLIAASEDDPDIEYCHSVPGWYTSGSFASLSIISCRAGGLQRLRVLVQIVCLALSKAVQESRRVRHQLTPGGR